MGQTGGRRKRVEETAERQRRGVGVGEGEREKTAAWLRQSADEHVDGET